MRSGGLVDGRHRRLPTHPQHSLSLPDRVYTRRVLSRPHGSAAVGAREEAVSG